jgi:hypothetical protein
MTSNLQLVILDDTLEPHEVAKIDEIFANYESSRQHDKLLGFSEFVYLENNFHNIFLKFIDYAKNYFNLNKMYGYEFWFNSSSVQGKPWHKDYDINLFKNESKLEYPVCSIVYYLDVDKCDGGTLETDTGFKIEPKKNRIVIFKGDLNHRVTNFTGTRISLVINPWDNAIDTRSKLKITKDNLTKYKNKLHATN